MQRSFATSAAALSVAVVMAACGKEAARAADPAKDEDKAVWLKKDDHSLDKPTAEAKATLPIFWRHLAEDKGVENALVKVGFPTRHGGVEYLWVGLTDFTETGVRGIIVNEPEDVANVHNGQSYEVKRSEISDWAYFKGGKPYGQFTTRVLLEHASPQERQEQLETLAPTPLEPGDR